MPQKILHKLSEQPVERTACELNIREPREDKAQNNLNTAEQMTCRDVNGNRSCP